MSNEKKMTHTAWAQRFKRGKFYTWLEVGEGRIDTDSTGQAIAHVYTDRVVRGDNGYVCLMPKGTRPPDPPPPSPILKLVPDDDEPEPTE